MAFALGCQSQDVDDGSPKGETSMIVFGITQRTDPVTGRTTTTAGHEYRFIGWEDVSFGPWAAAGQSMPTGTCVQLESTRTSERPNVGDGGRARFSGSALPADGIVIDANGADPTIAAPSFDEARPLIFALESGFAVPRFDPVSLAVPSSRLRWSEEPRVDGLGDLHLAWSSGDPATRVMVVFQPDEGARHLRCFFDGADGGALVKSRDLRGLGHGTLTLASHRQQVVTPGAGWTVEVFAAAIVDERPFSIE